MIKYGLFSALSGTHCNSEVNSPTWPEFEHFRDFMAIQLPASLTKIRSKVKSLSSGQHVLHYKSMGKCFVAQGRVTPNGIVRSRPNSNCAEILGLSWLSTSLMKIWSKMKTLLIGQHFPHYKPMGAFGCHGNQSCDSICPNTLCNLFPNLNDASYKLWSRLAKWPQRYSSLKVWTTDDRRTAAHLYTISSACELVSLRLTWVVW